MNSYGSRMLGRLVRAGLSTRLVVGLVAVIFLTVAAIALPAYSLVRTELERQAWSRVDEGATSSLALFNAGQSQLDQLATLAAQRPTLRSILRGGNRQELEAYLTAFAEGAGVAEDDCIRLLVTFITHQCVVPIGAGRSGQEQNRERCEQ